MGEIIRRLLRHSARKLNGTLLAVPVVVVAGLFTRPAIARPSRSEPVSRALKPVAWAHVVWQFKSQVLDRATTLICTPAHSPRQPAADRADLSNDDTAAMANAFGVPVVINSVLGEGPFGKWRKPRAFRSSPTKPVKRSASTSQHSCGVKGVLNIMQHLGMIGIRRTKPPAEPYIARSSSWVRAERDGVFLSLVALGAWIKKGGSDRPDIQPVRGR